MIDIHCHVLPMVDDGAASVEEALKMVKEAYMDGTDAMILTPHLSYAYGFINPYEKINELFHEFQYIVEREQIPIELYLGCEFHFSSKDDFLDHFDEITRINHTKYLLMEFFFNVEGSFILEAITMVKEKGLIPIIAHPERYDCMDEQWAKEIIDQGALLQMNKGSVLSRHGRHAYECVLDLLDHHYISFVGSDAHHINVRTPYMYESYQYVKDYYGKTYADYIFNDHAKEVLIRK